MVRVLRAIFVAGLLWTPLGPALAKDRRVALVVGVGAYEAVAPLANPVPDAEAVADLLREAGFELVTARTNLRNLEFKRALREFEESAAEADIAVVFYAGHGIEANDRNYLIPADAKLANERDLDDEAIALDRLITAAEPARRLRLIILDACRDNPFTAKIKRRVATRAIHAGLAKVEPPSADTLIAYAAKDRSVAFDGADKHSPFTTALLKNLTIPGLDIRLAFGRVRDDVLQATGRRQEPFVYGSLGGGTIALMPATEPAQQVALSTGSGMKADYEIVERVGKREAWNVFLQTYPSGFYADLARLHLARLSENPTGNEIPRSEGTRPVPSLAPPKLPSPVRLSETEQKAWNRLSKTNDIRAIRRFIVRYPTSPLLARAEERVGELERRAQKRAELEQAEREATRLRLEEETRRRTEVAERRRLEQEAVRRRQEEDRAKAAELERQKAEAAAAAPQREAEERARVAEAAARRREEEERARAAELAAQRAAAERQAKAVEAEKRRADQEAAERRREQEHAQQAAAAAHAAREAQQRVHRLREAESYREERVRAAEEASRKRDDEDRVKAADFAAKRKEEERVRVLEAEGVRAEQIATAERRVADERARAAAAEAQRVAARAEEERRKADQAAGVLERQKADREAAERAKQRAEAARRQAEEAAASRKKAAEATRRAAEQQRVQRAAVIAEQRRRLVRAARPAVQQSHPTQAETTPVSVVRATSRTSSPIIGVGF